MIQQKTLVVLFIAVALLRAAVSIFDKMYPVVRVDHAAVAVVLLTVKFIGALFMVYLFYRIERNAIKCATTWRGVAANGVAAIVFVICIIQTTVVDMQSEYLSLLCSSLIGLAAWWHVSDRQQ